MIYWQRIMDILLKSITCIEIKNKVIINKNDYGGKVTWI